MRAIVLSRTGGPEELEARDVARPEVGEGEVLLRVGAEGVCGRDLIDRRGGFPALKLPIILGHEFAGQVVAVGAGASTGFSAGDRVANLLIASCGKCPACARGDTPFCSGPKQSFGQTRDGGYAELVAVPAQALVRVPAEVSDIEAASVACTFGVALRGLRTMGNLAPGERVLITGASGGVGMAAIQVARALGAKVLAATSSESKRAALLEVGADDVVVDRGEELHRKVRASAPDGVDLALELTGSPTFTSALRSLRIGGRLILVGNIQTEPVKLNPGAVILNGLQIRGTAGCTRADLEDVLALIASKKMRVILHSTLPLAQAADAHRILADRAAVGRIVLVP